MRTLVVEEQTFKKLEEIQGEMKSLTGELKSYDQIIQELMDFWKKKAHDTPSINVKITYTKSPPPGTVDPRLAQQTEDS